MNDFVQIGGLELITAVDFDDVVAEEADLVTIVDGFVPVPGPPGGVTIKGDLDSVDDLPVDGNEVNDGWLIDGELWVWSDAGAWLNAGPVQGPPGTPGADSTVPGPAGPQGIQGIQGVEGPQGDQGIPGAAGGGTQQSIWRWLAGATSSTVAAGRVGVNNDLPSLATAVWISKNADDATVDFSITIGALVANDHVLLQAKTDATSFHRYTVTSPPTLVGGTTWSIPVITDSGSPQGTEPSGSAEVVVAFQFQPLQGPAGPAGPAGPGGPQGIQGIQGVPGVGVPAGGTVEQVLTKTSGVDYAASWQDPVWLVVKTTQPTAADYGLTTIPVGAVWIQSP